MTASTDYLGLHKHRLFKELRGALPQDIIKTQNVLTIKDGVLFTWDFQNCCVLTLNVKENRCRGDDSLSHQAQEVANMMIESFELCPKYSPGGDLITFLSIKNQNRGHQLLDLNYTALYPLGTNVLVKVKLEKESTLHKNTWLPVFHFEDERGICHAVDAYLGQVAYAIEQRMGIIPKTCPIPKGSYRAFDCPVDFNNLKIRTFPFGRVRSTVELYNKANNKQISCQVITLSNVAY